MSFNRTGEIQPGPPHVPKRACPHVATEYEEKGDQETAASLVRGLLPWARWSVLGRDPFERFPSRPLY